MILLLAILFNTVEAVIESLAERFATGLADIIDRIHALIVIAVFVCWLAIIPESEIPFWKLVLGFIFVRFLIYDIIWNLTSILCGAKISIWHYGIKKLYDRIMQQLVSWGWFMKAVLGIIGICFLLGWK